MADKFEREIEEILAKLDDQLPPDDGNPGRTPISIQQKRQQKARAKRVRTARPNPFANLSPTTLLFAGAGIMFAGLIVSGFWGPAIWASLAGIALFIGAFLWSFRRTPRSSGGSAPRQGHYWRDRWIDDAPPPSGVKGWFRKK
ncbi:MAG TPA: hypothetical protein PKI89_10205 [Tepidiformaceae bacterium]|nr:hypothetical protein [Tepidiformaceae bacterium]